MLGDKQMDTNYDNSFEREKYCGMMLQKCQDAAGKL